MKHTGKSCLSWCQMLSANWYWWILPLTASVCVLSVTGVPFSAHPPMNKHTDEGIIKHTSGQFVIFLYFEYEWEIDVLRCPIISFEKIRNENRRVPWKPFSQTVLHHICWSDSVCTSRDVAEILQHCWQLAIMTKYYTYSNLPRLPSREELLISLNWKCVSFFYHGNEVLSLLLTLLYSCIKGLWRITCTILVLSIYFDNSGKILVLKFKLIQKDLFSFSYLCTAKDTGILCVRYSHRPCPINLTQHGGVCHATNVYLAIGCLK